MDIMVVMVYMPTTSHPDKDIDEMHEHIESGMNFGKSGDYLVLLGD